jgi:uncharacterized integral membrane protein (TIGR00698 family)
VVGPIIKVFNNYLKFLKSIFPGLVLISAIILLANFISQYMFIGSIASAIIIGIIVKQFFTIPDNCKDGINYSEKKLLNIAIILLGSTLDLSTLYLIDTKIVGLLILLIITSILSSIILGRIFNLSPSLSLLLGIGNGICGSSAIAAASPVLNAKEDDIGLSISTINILGAFGIFILPLTINSFFSGSLENQGIIIGSTIQAVGQVTAAGFIMGDEVGQTATLIKMIRILMLGPLLVCLTLIYSPKTKNHKRFLFSIPSFIVGFTILCVIVNLGCIPMKILPFLSNLSKYCLLFAMSAIGLNISIKSIIDKGYKVFIVASITFGLQIFLSIYLLSIN